MGGISGRTVYWVLIALCILTSLVTGAASLGTSSQGGLSVPALVEEETLDLPPSYLLLNTTVAWRVVEENMAEVTVTVAAHDYAPNTVSEVEVPSGLSVVCGETRWEGDLEAGQTATYSFTLRAEETGFWELEAHSHSSRGYDWDLDGYSIFYVYYDKKIRLSETPPQDLVREECEATSGKQLGGELGPGGFKAGSTVTVGGRVLWEDGNGNYHIARCIVVEFYSDGSKVGETVTDQNGDYTFTFSRDDVGNRLWIRFYTKAVDPLGTIVEVKRGNSLYYAEMGINIPSTASYVDAGALIPSPSKFEIVGSIVDAYYWIYEHTGYAQPKVVVKIQENWPHSHGTEIHIPDSPDWIHDRTTHMHEYAHCIQYRIYGNRWPRSSSIGSSHTVASEYDEGFAICEGWAEFLPCAIQDDPDALRGYGGNIESNDWQNVQDVGDMDGHRVEGCVASVLWDIFDDHDEPDIDWLDAGFDEIWTIMRGHNPDSMLEFWHYWFEEDFGHRVEMNHIYWDHGIDENVEPIAYIVDPTTTRPHWASGPITITVETHDTDGYVRRVRFYAYDSVTGTQHYIGVDSDGSDGWSITVDPEDLAPTPLPDYFDAWIEVEAYDGMETGPRSQCLHVRYEFQEPTITINMRSTFSDSEVPSFQAVIEDSMSGLKNVSIGIASCFTSYMCNGENTYTVYGTTYVSLDLGTYSYSVSAADRAGNVASESGTFTVVDDDDEPPEFLSLYANVEGRNVKLCVVLNDDSGIDSVEFRYRIGDGEWSDWQGYTSRSPIGYAFYYTIEGVFEGVPRFATSTKTITWQVRAVDADNDRPGDKLEATSQEQVDEVTYRPSIIDSIIGYWEVYIAGIITSLIPISLIALARRLRRR